MQNDPRSIQRKRFIRTFMKDKTAVIGAIILVSMVIIAVFAPAIAPESPTRQSLLHRLAPPGDDFLLGADRYGRDQLSRVLWGTRVSISVGIASVLAGAAVGIPLGLIGGFVGGRLDRFAVLVTDVFLAFPSVVLAMLIVSLLGTGVDRLIWAIGFTFVPRFIRLTRASALSLKGREYIEGGRAIGCSTPYLIFRYVLPNIFGQTMAMGSLFIGLAIRSEATLGFIGLGVAPPTASWGGMLRDGLMFLRQAPWLTIWPSVAIFITILSINMLGDGLRDTIDPKISKVE